MNMNIDVMKGVVKADVLSDALRSLRDGEHNARSYVRGALQYLTHKPPNPHIVPLLRHALEKYK